MTTDYERFRAEHPEELAKAENELAIEERFWTYAEARQAWRDFYAAWSRRLSTKEPFSAEDAYVNGYVAGRDATNKGFRP